MAFKQKLNFLHSVEFCQKLGGEMAVAINKETFGQMNRSHAEVCPNRNRFFSGYIRGGEGEWRDVNTWSSWAEGRTDRGRKVQCSVIKVSSGQMVDVTCTSDPMCPICRIKLGAMLQISGVCSHSRIYVLKSESELLETISTRMIQETSSLHWIYRRRKN